MKLKWRNVSLIIASALLALTFVVIYASDEGWGQTAGVSNSLNLSNSGDTRQPAITLEQDKIAVIWSGVGKQDDRGIFRAVGTTIPLTTTPPLTLTGEEDAWSPSTVYAGDELRVAWVQGDYYDPQSPVGRLLQQDENAGEGAKILMDPVYGYTAPRLLSNNTGDHLLIASSETHETSTQANLYYMCRPAGAEAWLSPTMVITHAHAQPPSGGIWYPHAALAGDEIHVVWEQTNKYQSHSIWHISGIWQEAQQTFSWGEVERLSVPGQKAVRPKVTVDSSNRAHVTWVEEDVGQYVNYRRRENDAWHPALGQDAVRLDQDPVQVNSYRPTWSTISMATWDDNICVAWHGYRAPIGETGEEEIYLNCSKNGGKTWSDIVTNVSETPNRLSLFPAMAIDDAGKLHIAWEEHMGGDNFKSNYDIHYRSGPLPKVQKFIYLPLVMRGARQ